MVAGQPKFAAVAIRLFEGWKRLRRWSRRASAWR